jgi:hypothetical protein
MSIYEELTLAIQRGELTSVQLEKFATEIQQQAVEESLKALPFVIKNLIATTGKLQEVRDNFYARNETLADHKALVTKVMEELEHKNPGMSVERLAELTATEAKQRLRQMETMPVDKVEKPSTNSLTDSLNTLLGDMK